MCPHCLNFQFMSFWNTLGKIGGAIFKGVTAPASLVIDAGKAVAGLVSNNQANKTASHLTDKQISAQKEANQYNIQAQKDINASNILSQEKINQKNIDIAKELNALARRDAQHAISDKRTDLMRAGYSSASPDLSGFSPASLTSPQLTAPQSVAPQMQPEFTPEIASTLINSRSTSISSMAEIAKTLTDIDLARAQKQKTNAETQGILKNNAWIDLEKNASYANMLEQTEKLVQDQKVSEATALFIIDNTKKCNAEIDLLKVNLESAKITNSQLADRLKAELAEVNAHVKSLNAGTDLAKSQKELNDIKKEFETIVNRYAKMGINFNSGSFISQLGALLTSEAPAGLVNSAIDAISSALGAIVENIKIF